MKGLLPKMVPCWAYYTEADHDCAVKSFTSENAAKNARSSELRYNRIYKHRLYRPGPIVKIFLPRKTTSVK